VARAQPPRPPAARSATGSLRAVSGARPPAAQECFDHAKTAAAQGNLSTAIALLRRALQLSPRDSEIAGFLGQLAFKGRGTPDPTHKP
jgi:Flp pilus assembly protein TadD